MGGCQKHQTRERGTRERARAGIGRPAPDVDAALGKGRPKRFGMIGNSPSRSTVVGKDQQPAGLRRAPASFGRNDRCEPRLAIERQDRRLKVRDDGLDLDDENHSRRRVKRQEIDRATLAADIERDFDRDVPAERSSRPATWSTSAAWLASRRRSSASPFQSTRSSTRAPRAFPMASIVRIVTRSSAPSSILEIVLLETRAAAARSSCRHLRRRRRARIDLPIRTVSTHRGCRRRIRGGLSDAYRTNNGTPGATAPATSTTTYAAMSSSPTYRCSRMFTPITAIRTYGLS